MKKINLKGISEILSSKELKNVFGGSVSGSGSNPGGGGGTSCLGSGRVCWIGSGTPCCRGACNHVIVEHIPQLGGGSAALWGWRCP